MNLFRTLAMVGLVGVGMIGNVVCADQITSLNIKETIHTALPNYIFVTGDNRMIDFPSSTSLIPRKYFTSLQAHCVLTCQKSSDNLKPKDLAKIIYYSFIHELNKKQITFGTEGERYPKVDLSDKAFGQYGLSSYTKNNDGTFTHELFTVQASVLLQGEVLITYTYTKAITPNSD